MEIELEELRKIKFKRIIKFTAFSILNFLFLYSARSIAFLILGYNKFIFKDVNTIPPGYGHIYSRAFQESREIVIGITILYIVVSIILFSLILVNSYIGGKFKIFNQWHSISLLLNIFFLFNAILLLIFFRL